MANLTIAEYAKHRAEHKLPGASPAAVRKALRSGRITLTPEGGIDPTAADAAWRSHTDIHQQGRRTQARSGLADDQRRLIQEQTVKLALANAEKRRELAPVTLLTEAAARSAKRVAAVLDGVPGAIKRRVPDIDDATLEVMRHELVKARNLAAECDIDLSDLADA